MVVNKSYNISTENKLLTSRLDLHSKKTLDLSHSTENALLYAKVPKLSHSLVPTLNLTSSRNSASASSSNAFMSTTHLEWKEPRISTEYSIEKLHSPSFQPMLHSSVALQTSVSNKPPKFSNIRGLTLPPLSSARTPIVKETTKQRSESSDLGRNENIFETSPSLAADNSTSTNYLREIWDGLVVTSTKKTSLPKTKLSSANVDEVNQLKLNMVDKLAAALINSPNFTSKNPVTEEWITILRRIANFDPEFILKLSLYTREELNIRTAANFLVAFAAFHDSTKQFIDKYYNQIVRLPSDWLEIVELGQYFADKSKKYGEIPKPLRLAMSKRFLKFDAYQLAKYNKEKARLKKSRKPHFVADEIDGEIDIFKSRPQEVKNVFTLKRMIRCLHLSEPVEHVMGVLGKTYPATYAEFYNSHLPGIFDEEKAGKRMKLPTPETWETQVSTGGNKAEVWETLMDNQKLPYMALLRNIRNLLRAGISLQHHQKATKRLGDRESVVRSRQLPMRFLSAYEVLKQLDKEKETYKKWEKLTTIALSGRVNPRRRGRPVVRSDPKTRRAKALEELKKLMPKAEQAALPSIAKSLRKSTKYSAEDIAAYRKAIDTAISVATTYNIQPIRGKTLVFLDMGASHSVGGAKNPNGPSRTASDVAALLAFMCRSSSEHCEIYAYSGNSPMQHIESERGSILELVTSLKSRFEGKTKADEHSFNPVLTQLLKLMHSHYLFDTFIWFDGQNDSFQTGSEVDSCLNDIAKFYVETIRQSTLFVHVNLSKQGLQKNTQKKLEERNDKTISPYLIHLAGCSDSILRFIAERSDASRLRYINNIDKKYKLSSSNKAKSNRKVIPTGIDLFPSSEGNNASKGNCIRIFISSTFRDMHGERDLLTRFVIPQLRLNAAKIGLQIYDVDLRWGITEAESNQSVEICLSEAKRADLFVCILGERYGHCPGPKVVENVSAEFPEIKGFENCSITELEIRVAALNSLDRANRRRKSFFYFRDTSHILEKIPRTFVGDYYSESPESAVMLTHLKNEVRRSGFSVMDGYFAEMGEIDRGTKICRASHLEDFAEHVTVDLWNSLTQIVADISGIAKNSQTDNFEPSLQLHTNRLTYLQSSFAGRGQFCQDAVQKIKNGFGSASYFHSGIVILHGGPGVGKSAVFAQIINELTKLHVAVCLYYFADAAPSCAAVSTLVDHFVHCLLRIFSSSGFDDSDLLALINNEEEQKQPTFVELLQVLRKTQPNFPILLAIDGLDVFESDQSGLSFLPENTDYIPENVILMVSCRSGSLANAAADRMSRAGPSSSHRPMTLTMAVPALNISDRSNVIKAILNRYGKELSTSAWNNQLSLLTQKRQAGLPAYLAMACEELRLFGLYEELSLRLKKLPHTMTQLMEDIISRLEVDHTKALVENACCLLVVAPSGLSEGDLRRLVSYAITLGPNGMQELQPGLDTLSPIAKSIKLSAFCKLVQSLKGFLNQSADNLILSDSNMIEIINKVYFGITSLKTSARPFSRSTISARAKSAAYASPGFEKKSLYCRLIATHFCEKFLNRDGAVWSLIDALVLTDLPYFLTMSGAFHELSRLLTSFHYLAARCQSSSSVQSLLADFGSASVPPHGMPSRMVTQLREDFGETKSVKRVEQFLRRNQALISLGFPHLLWQAAFNDSDSAIRSTAAKSFDAALANFGELAMVVKSWPVDDEGETSIKSIPIAKKQNSMLCVAVSDKFVAFGCEDAQVFVYHRDANVLFRTLIGHSAAVTALAFSDDNMKLFSASHDRTVSCWDVEAGSRINIFEHHQRPITGCSTCGKLLATCSTDCTVTVYDVRTNKMLVRIYDSCPLNDVALHPSGDGRLVVACWDTAVRMWSSTPPESTRPSRIAIFRGHSSPVTAVAFSPSGKYVASGNLEGEIRLFLAEHAVQVGVLGIRNGFSVTSLQYAKESLISASADWSIRVWSKSLGRQIAAFCHDSRASSSQAKRPKSSSVVRSNDGIAVMATSRDNKYIGYATKSGYINVVSAELFMKSPSFAPSSVKVDTAFSPVLAMTFTASEPHRLIYSCQSGVVTSIDLESKNKFQLAGFNSAVPAIASNMRFSATGCSDSIVRLYHNYLSRNSKSKEMLPIVNLSQHKATVTCLFMDEDYLISGDMDGSICSWSLNTKKLKIHIVRAHGDGVSGVSLTKNHIISTGSDIINCWSLEGNLVHQVGSHSSVISSLTCSEGCVVTGDCSGVIKVHSWKGIEVTSLKNGAASVIGLSVNIELNKESEIDLGIEDERPFTGFSWADECEEEDLKKQISKRQTTSPSTRQRNITVYSGNSDGWLRAYRPLEAEVRSVLKGHVGTVTAVAIAESDSTGCDIVSTSLDSTCKQWSITCGEETVETTNNKISSTSNFAQVPIRSFFTKNRHYFVVASSTEIFVWKIDSVNGVKLIVKDKLPKTINDIVSSITALDSFYVCFDDAVWVYRINENSEQSPLNVITRLMGKDAASSLFPLDQSETNVDKIMPYGCVVSHPNSSGLAFVVSKFYRPLPLSVEISKFDDYFYTAVRLVDGRVRFIGPITSNKKTVWEFSELVNLHKNDLPLVTFLPEEPNFCVVAGHKSNDVYLVQVSVPELKWWKVGNFEHSSPVTCVRACCKFILSASAEEQLIKLWRLSATSDSLHLIGLLPFDSGRIADVCFCNADTNDTTFMVVDHLGSIYKFKVISDI